MILVDTSVLIDALEGRSNEQVHQFKDILNTGTPFGISPFVYQEVLQGAKNEKEFLILKEYLSLQRFYHLQEGNRSYEEAARIYFKGRRHGITLGPIDCLIAQTAVENKLRLLHRDRDFDKMAEIIPLQIFR